MLPPLPDISSRHDIVQLVDAFYERVGRDELLGPIFNDVARVDWDAHLPRMYDFWDSVLFGRTGFKGNPLAVHRALAQLTPLTSREFTAWLTLFHATVDALFSGAVATQAKVRASRIAATMQLHLADPSAGLTAGRTPQLVD
jgi:hemoglobin